MFEQLLLGFAIYLIIEGMIPFISPNFFRKTVFRLAQMDDNSVRFTGLVVTSLGLILLYMGR